MINKFLPVLNFFLYDGGGVWGLGMSARCIWCTPRIKCFECQEGVPPALTSPVNINMMCVFCGAPTSNKENYPLGSRQVGRHGNGDTFPQ